MVQKKPEDFDVLGGFIYRDEIKDTYFTSIIQTLNGFEK
jgi:hypothetical protein